MNVQIVTYGAKVLREPTQPIQQIDDSHIKVVNRLRFALSKVNGYGVAAPQIGESLPIFNYEDGNKVKTIINPKIEESSDTLWTYPEGCLSIPGFTFLVERPERVLLSGMNTKGDSVEIEAEGLLARIFQHEMDHLDGVLTIDRLDEEQLEAFKAKWKPVIRKKKKRR